jgi:hypothetical protein
LTAESTRSIPSHVAGAAGTDVPCGSSRHEMQIFQVLIDKQILQVTMV